MAVTRLKRKALKNKARSSQRKQKMKIQNFQPTVKKVDVEEAAAEFKKGTKKPAKKIAKEEEKKAEEKED
ncbi:hypothetical protein OO013_00895 [Mangrovivirga sp. M17]|uniref:50S ribosomal protein L32 n=1 Tax=Mangrovivirga halotolerans TaxID=2993936 RepID=A0ABT3RKQ3_9BACT|nr:hypothetical protein [Mangrovivirga halotolerans]MCX2742397.1 hypothetical protein [Mangrovivirga halotolerans]